jgi:AraC-like DNA-binding protein
MRLQLERTGHLPGQKTWQCYALELPAFELYWHNHAAYELTYIAAGYGRRLVGDSMARFEPGDLVLLGPHLPHSWVSDTDCPAPVKAWVLQVSPACFDTLLQLPGMEGIGQILDASRQGLLFAGGAPKAATLLQQLSEAQATPLATAQLLMLLHHLLNLAHQPLAAASYAPGPGSHLVESRLNKVLQWLHTCYTTPQAHIPAAAALLHMQKSAFCKFFKRHTGKAFTNYINDMRIAYACRMLAETDDTIARIAYGAGYENLSYFNRTFLCQKGVTPGNFRKAHR